MTEADVEQIIQRARERFPGVTPRIISDHGPQFLARDFKECIRLCGLTHARTSPYYPQSNGKIERWHRILTEECIRPGTPLTLADARRIVGKFVDRERADYGDLMRERFHDTLGDRYVEREACECEI